MIHKLSDFSLNSNVEFSLKEEDFKACLKNLYGIRIHQTCFVKGAMNQCHLYIWVDFKKGDVLRSSEIHLPSDCPYSEKDIIALYFNSFQLPPDDYSETYLHLYDFKGALLAYAYGNGIVGLRERIKATSLWKYDKVYLDYAKLRYCVVYDGEKRNFTDEEYQELLHSCLSALKVHDHYHIISMSDVRLEIVNKTQTHTSEWNDIYMTNNA